MRELPKLVFEAECRSNVDREIQILPTLSQLPAVLDALVNVAFSALPPDICSNQSDSPTASESQMTLESNPIRQEVGNEEEIYRRTDHWLLREA